jgi:hypothetical protein
VRSAVRVGSSRRIGSRLAAGAVALVAALALAGCSNTSGSPSHQVQQWADSSGYTNASGSTGLGQFIAGDLAGLKAGLRARDLGALRTACAGFTQDADNLYSELPTPDETLTNEFALSLTEFSEAGADCYQASGFRAAKFLKYEKLLKSGTAEYDRALARLKSFGVSDAS